MTAKGDAERFSFSRWSRRKLEGAAEKPAPAPTSSHAAAAAPPLATASGASVPSAPVELPPVESLTFESDFTAFLRPGVDDKVKRAALKQLFRDPRFNVMDGLDTYIDDYTKADPIPPDMLADLLQRGFGSAAETGREQTAAVNALPEEPGVTDATQPALSAGGEHGAMPSQPPLATEPGGEGAPAKRGADEGDIARADDGVDTGGIHRQR